MGQSANDLDAGCASSLLMLQMSERVGKVKGDTSGSDVGGVHTGSGNSLVELHELLTLFETPQEGSQRSDI
jgi:hypothetical protein